MNFGSLELIIGPMYAGKSTELIKRIKMYQILEKNVLIVNHKINNRYGTDGISTHDKTKCDKVFPRRTHLRYQAPRHYTHKTYFARQSPIRRAKWQYLNFKSCKRGDCIRG